MWFDNSKNDIYSNLIESMDSDQKKKSRKKIIREKGIIKGRVINIKNEAPSFWNDVIHHGASGYMVGEIISLLKFLISNEPIDRNFWIFEKKDKLEFNYNGEKVRVWNTRSSKYVMRALLNGEIDISDWIHDLTILIGISSASKEEIEKLKKEAQKKINDGIEKIIVK